MALAAVALVVFGAIECPPVGEGCEVKLGDVRLVYSGPQKS